jgi:DNA-binding transcriptional regulator of glucitol operon
VSLKAFHVFFIVIATLCSLMLGGWGVAEHSRTGNGGALFLGICGFAAAALLVVYGLWFLRKLRGVST